MVIKIKFRGVRGSYPVAGEEFARYGWASTCCEVLVDKRLLIFDAGSGIIPLGQELLQHKIPACSLYYTHFHVDHCFGMNFFQPLFRKNTEIAIIGPVQGKGSLKRNLEFITDELIHPVGIAEFPCKKHFVDIRGGEILGYKPGEVAPEVITPEQLGQDRLVVKTLFNAAHSQLGVINYRVEHAGRAFVFATDIEGDPSLGYNKALAEFAAGADLLAMDGQYSETEYVSRQGWGHSTFAMACRTAAEAGVGKLAIIHHDPAHDDEFLDRVEAELQNASCPVILAREGGVEEL